MSLNYAEDIQMFYDDHIPITKLEKSKSKVTPINFQGSSDLNSTGTSFQVVWIDKRNRKFEINIRVSSNLIVKEFISIVIGEFNQLFKREEIDEFFFTNEAYSYELYEMDSDDKPNEELPSYDDNQKLRKTKSFAFALKQTLLIIPSLMVSSISDPQSCKSPISPRSEEEKFNSCNKTIQNTEQYTQESEKVELTRQAEELQEEQTNQMWCLCCCQF